jgi:hypothetical protein
LAQALSYVFRIEGLSSKLGQLASQRVKAGHSIEKGFRRRTGKKSGRSAGLRSLAQTGD